jgi:hypothetical protein
MISDGPGIYTYIISPPFIFFKRVMCPGLNITAQLCWAGIIIIIEKRESTHTVGHQL